MIYSDSATILSAAISVVLVWTNLLSAQHIAELQSEVLRVVVADNEAFGAHHRPGYNGVAELSLRGDSVNLFIPEYAGLNFEHIFSGDDQSFSWNKFEPRQSPMKLVRLDENTVELRQVRTTHWPLRSRIKYELDGDAIDFTYCGTPSEDEWSKHGYIGIFFASYIHQPPAMGIHFIGQPRDHADQAEPKWIYHLPPNHGVAANHRPAGSRWDPPIDEGFPIPLVEGHSHWEYTFPLYFGRVGDRVFIMMFAEPPPGGEIRFAQSPSGAGSGNPAWDFIFLKRDYAVDQEFCFIGRAVYKEFVSEADVLQLYEQWSGQTVPRPPVGPDRIISVPNAAPTDSSFIEAERN